MSNRTKQHNVKLCLIVFFNCASALLKLELFSIFKNTPRAIVLKLSSDIKCKSSKETQENFKNLAISKSNLI